MRTGTTFKRTGCGLLLPMLCWLATISAATADQFGEFTYEINTPDTNTVTITGHTGAGNMLRVGHATPMRGCALALRNPLPSRLMHRGHLEA